MNSEGEIASSKTTMEINFLVRRSERILAADIVIYTPTNVLIPIGMYQSVNK